MCRILIRDDSDFILHESGCVCSVLIMIRGKLHNRALYLVVSTDGPQLHDELEAEEVVGPNGLKLQETTESYKLRSGQVVQRQLILKQFGEF